MIRLRRALVALALVTLSGLTGSPALATTAVLLTRDELVDASDIVIEATVTGASAGLAEDGRTHVTRTALAVRRYAKGAGPRSWTVRQLGGKVGDRSMHVVGDAKLERGQHVVVFLRRGAGDGNAYLTAMAQAVYFVGDDQRARRRLGGVTLVRKIGDRFERIEENEPAETVDRLVGDVQRRARRPR